MQTVDHTPRFVRLHQLLNELPSALPRPVEHKLADVLLAATVAGKSDEELRAIAGDARYRNGYRVDPVRAIDFTELRCLVRRARAEIGRTQRTIGELEAKRAAIERLLQPE